MSDERSGLYSKASGLLPLFVVYVFLPGAVYLNFYYRSFGVSTRWLDIPASEVLLRAFTLMLDFRSAFAIIFGVLLLGPLLVESISNLRTSVVANTVLVAIYIASPLYFYVESRSNAIEDAKRDKGMRTTLPFVRYSIKNCSAVIAGTPPLPAGKKNPAGPAQNTEKNCQRRGRLVLIRDQTLFVMNEPDVEDVREIQLLRSDSVENVTIVRSSQ